MARGGLGSALLMVALSGAAGAGDRLTVVNGCGSKPIWIASDGVSGAAVVKLLPGARHTYSTPNGLHSTRFWPKMGCNDAGQACTLGDSGGTGQSCATDGCAPPVDSKFEASFGNQAGDCKTSAGNCDWWDTSGVDGFTLPYKVEISDHCKTNGYKGVDVDCSALALSECPRAESLGSAGSVDLHLLHPHSHEVVGCYSPCSKLTMSNWNNPTGTHAPQDSVANPFCCPTPPVSPAQCRAGPAAKSQYSNLIHAKCPHVYSYAYDDGVGLQVCPPETLYTWTLFCPPASSNVTAAVLI